jgi:D-alanine-D-alanine ligase
VQAILEQQGCAYTGCGIQASQLAFDKAAAKARFAARGVPTPHGQTWTRGEAVTVSLPLVIKPACQGSSFGLQFVNNVAELAGKLEQALQYGETQIIENLVVGRELTVGILGDDVLPIVEIKPKSGHYDYTTKYTPGATDYTCPASLSAEVTARAQAMALAAHKALGCTVYSRVDVMLDETENPWVLEVNTIPGMTATSLLPKAAQAAGLSFDQLCQKIVELSLEVKGEDE